MKERGITRHRRSRTSELGARIEVILADYDDVIELELERMEESITRSARVEWIHDNYTESSLVRRDCLYSGHVINHTDQVATLSMCHGMVSVQQSYFINDSFVGQQYVKL